MMIINKVKHWQVPSIHRKVPYDLRVERAESPNLRGTRFTTVDE